MPTLAEAALAAADRGWHVFPLRPGDKRPAVRDWERRATTDPARIQRCWLASPWLNVGIACGPSRLVVVDLDTPKAGVEPPPQWRQPDIGCGLDALAVLAERHRQPLPVNTYCVRTASGGEHLYYTAPAGQAFRNTAGKLGWLIDTRAAGGYVVAAGSIVNGQPYVVLDDLPPAPLPGWLATGLNPPRQPVRVGQFANVLATVRRRSAYAAAALRAELDTVLAARQGSRNHTLNAAAYALGQLAGAGLLPELLATQALTEAGHAIGLDEAECAATIRSGLSAGARHPRTAD